MDELDKLAVWVAWSHVANPSPVGGSEKAAGSDNWAKIEACGGVLAGWR